MNRPDASITYAREDALTLAEFQAVLASSHLAERYPAEPERLQAMLDGSDLIVTARSETGTIVGLTRSITDWAYCLYCSDLAVDPAYQGHGIGRRLLAETAARAPGVRGFYLLSTHEAVSFYEHAGFQRLATAFQFAAGP